MEKQSCSAESVHGGTVRTVRVGRGGVHDVPVFSETCRLSIDPGLSGTGLAWWSEQHWGDVVPPIHAENLYCSVGATDSTSGSLAGTTSSVWQARARSLSEKLQTRIREYAPAAVYCEFPEFMDSASGVMVATKGDLQKLTFVVGNFAQVCWNAGIPFYPILVNEWKGQMSKQKVELRIRKRLPDLVDQPYKAVSHSIDAIGIGLFAKGMLHASRTR